MPHFSRVITTITGASAAQYIKNNVDINKNDDGRRK